MTEQTNMPGVDEVKQLKKGDLVKGKIVKIDADQVYVSTGYKYDGIIPIRELSVVPCDDPHKIVQLEQDIECNVLSVDDEKEVLILSKKYVDQEHAWTDLQKRYETQEVFEVVVSEVVKGGVVTDLGVRGFIPASMVERHFVEDFSSYKGKTLRVVVKEIDQENQKLILSQKDVLEKEYQKQREEILQNLKENQVIEGTVQRLTPFGAFIDIGGIDGLVHVSELSWSHVDKPSDVLKEGQKVKVKIIKLEPQNNKVSLSIKAALPGPWDAVGDTFKVGQVVKGTVRRIVNFGAFVEISPGIEGLVHISQIDHRHVNSPFEVLKEQQEVEVKIMELSVDDKKISLSIKEALPVNEVSEASKAKQEEYISSQPSPLSFTLAEKFGEQLSKLKK